MSGDDFSEEGWRVGFGGRPSSQLSVCDSLSTIWEPVSPLGRRDKQCSRNRNCSPYGEALTIQLLLLSNGNHIYGAQRDVTGLDCEGIPSAFLPRISRQVAEIRIPVRTDDVMLESTIPSQCWADGREFPKRGTHIPTPVSVVAFRHSSGTNHRNSNIRPSQPQWIPKCDAEL